MYNEEELIKLVVDKNGVRHLYIHGQEIQVYNLNYDLNFGVNENGVITIQL